jgi:hypothetical protein
MQNTVSEFLYVLYFLFFSNQEAEMRIDFAETLQFGSDWSNIELLLQFSATVLKGLVMQEYYVRFRKLFAGFFWNADVEILVQRSIYQLYLIALDYFYQLILGF